MARATFNGMWNIISAKKDMIYHQHCCRRSFFSRYNYEKNGNFDMANLLYAIKTELRESNPVLPD